MLNVNQGICFLICELSLCVFVHEKINLGCDKVFCVSDIGELMLNFNQDMCLLIREVFFCVFVCMKSWFLVMIKCFMLVLLCHARPSYLF